MYFPLFHISYSLGNNIFLLYYEQTIISHFPSCPLLVTVLLQKQDLFISKLQDHHQKPIFLELQIKQVENDYKVFNRIYSCRARRHKIMTVGENIRRIRLERNLTQKQLGELLGTSEAYIRAYESGRRNPKPATLKKIADVLDVNSEVLENSSFDAVTAMHRLFQLFRQYEGHLFQYEDESGKPKIALQLDTLSLMYTWHLRYKKYLDEIAEATSIKDVKQRANALLKAESDFDFWMDVYPEEHNFPDMLELQKQYDMLQDEASLHKIY